MDEILLELRKPFHPTAITWKPGMIGKDQSKALALAYADPRAYQNRLDEVCGLGWACSFTPWGDRIICHLTIGGVTRSSTGEPDQQSERAEISGTSAEAQAFKRACSAFGLGRYLYELPSVWVEYDPATKGFTDKAKAKLESIIVNHYRRQAGGSDRPATQVGQAQPQTPPPTAPEAAQAQTEGDQPPADAQAASGPPETPERVALRQTFNDAGLSLYGETWDQICRPNTERITGGVATDPLALSDEQIVKLIDGMRKLQRKRHTTPVASPPPTPGALRN